MARRADPAGGAGTWIRPLRFADATVVALNMRPADAEEIFACRYGAGEASDRAGLALEVAAAVSARGLGWVAGRDGVGEEPVAVFGAVEQWPGMWGAFQFATPAWPAVVRPVTRFALTTLRRALLARGARRCEVRSAAWRHDAHRWLEALGAVAEAAHPAHGRDGSAYLTFAWIAAGGAPGAQPEEGSHVHLQSAEPAATAATATTAAGHGRRRGASGWG